MYRRSIGRKIGINVLVFISKKKKHVHFVFLSFENHKEILRFIHKEWIKRGKKKKFSDYKMNYLKLSHQLNGNMIM